MEKGLLDVKEAKEFIRFCFAGSIITATDFSIYYILFHFLPYSAAKGNFIHLCRHRRVFAL